MVYTDSMQTRLSIKKNNAEARSVADSSPRKEAELTPRQLYVAPRHHQFVVYWRRRLCSHILGSV